jgi:hypothetical protein
VYEFYFQAKPGGLLAIPFHYIYKINIACIKKKLLTKGLAEKPEGTRNIYLASLLREE